MIQPYTAAASSTFCTMKHPGNLANQFQCGPHKIGPGHIAFMIATFISNCIRTLRITKTLNVSLTLLPVSQKDPFYCSWPVSLNSTLWVTFQNIEQHPLMASQHTPRWRLFLWLCGWIIGCDFEELKINRKLINPLFFFNRVAVYIKNREVLKPLFSASLLLQGAARPPFFISSRKPRRPCRT